MPKFGWCKFAEDKFGVQTKYHTLKFGMYGAILMGQYIRRTMNKKGAGEGGAVTYRVRRGNGRYGSVAGKIYQDKYNYPDVTGLENNAPYGAVRTFATAVEYWQEVLTDEEKKEYNRRAAHGWQMSGYNLFLREALRGEYHMFVDRGDPASYDFIKTDLTTDGAWHDLDLSAIVPKIARAIALKVFIKGETADRSIYFRKNGNIYACAGAIMTTQLIGIPRSSVVVIACDANQVIEYLADNITWMLIRITVNGWWT